MRLLRNQNIYSSPPKLHAKEGKLTNAKNSANIDSGSLAKNYFYKLGET